MYAFIASKQQRIIAGFIDLLFAMVVVLIIALSINSFLNDFQLSLADNLTLVRETQGVLLAFFTNGFNDQLECIESWANHWYAHDWY